MVGPYFRDRTGPASTQASRRSTSTETTATPRAAGAAYTLIPPLLFYHSDHEIDSSTTTVVGPVIAQSTAKRSVFDVAPLFFSIQGKPESGGVRESHTTLFPLFHYGYDPGELALHPAGLLPARVANLRHDAHAVLLAGRDAQRLDVADGGRARSCRSGGTTATGTSGFTPGRWRRSSTRPTARRGTTG